MRQLVFILPLLLSLPAMAQQIKADDHFEEGVLRWTEHEYDRAREHFDKALVLDAGLMEAYVYRAATLEQLGLPEKAILDYMIYLQVYPDQVEVLLSASVLNYQLKHYAQARDGFIRLNKLPSGVTSRVYYKQPVHGEGVTGMLTAQTENRSYLYNYLGLCEEGLENLAAARAYLDTAISIQQDNPDYYVNRGNILRKSGQISQAEEDYRKALALRPDHGLARYNLAHLLESGGDNSTAITYYSQSIEDNPSSPLAYRQRGYRLMINGELDEALADFDMAIALDPENAETLVNRGIIYNARQRYEEALNDFATAIELKPDFEKAYFNRGNTLYYLKEYDAALNDYNVALIYHPAYGQALYMRALTHYYLENFTQACEDITQAAKLDVNQAIRQKQKICAEVLSD